MESFIKGITGAESIGTKAGKNTALTGLSQDAQRLMMEALNPYRVFGVKKFKMPDTSAKLMHSQQDAQPFFKLLDDLASRNLTGNAARDAITATLMLYNAETQPLLARVLNKDLKAGFSESTLNKLYPDLVPTFDVMLADKVDAKYKWSFPYIGEAKYDGTRTIAIVENGKVDYYSRSGKTAFHLYGLFDEDLIELAKIPGCGIVVDGEALATDFRETMKAKKSTDNESKANLNFYCFDWMLLDDWKAKNCQTPQHVRSQTLEEVLSSGNYKKLFKSKHRFLNNKEEAMVFYNEMLEEGFEGLIIKDPNGLYEWDRSHCWSKWKPIIDVDVTITGFYLGNEGTKNANHLGGFYVEGEDENGNKIKSKSGGIKVNDKEFGKVIDEMAAAQGIDLSLTAIDENGNIYNIWTRDSFFRHYVWNNQAEFLGRMIKIEAQELSQNEEALGTNLYSLRFPVMVGFRDDKQKSGD